jgi:hypothetical protein
MLMALGAASAAWDAVKSLASQVSSASSSTKKSGFFGSGADPFTVSGSDSSQSDSTPSSSSASGALSPATMNALLAAQGQFSISALGGGALNPAAPTAASNPSVTPLSLASSSAASSYNAAAAAFQRSQLSAVA